MRKLTLKEISALSEDELNLLIMYYISDKEGDCNKPFVREDGSPDFEGLDMHFYSKRIANLDDPTQYPYEYYRKGVQYAAKDWANSLDALIELIDEIGVDEDISAISFTKKPNGKYKDGTEQKKWVVGIWSGSSPTYIEGKTKRVGAEKLLDWLQNKLLDRSKNTGGNP